MNDSGYILYELACHCIGMRISELSAQLADARRQADPDLPLIDDLKRRSSLLWCERYELSSRDYAAVEACLLTYSARPDRMPELIAGVNRLNAEEDAMQE